MADPQATRRAILSKLPNSIPTQKESFAATVNKPSALSYKNKEELCEHFTRVLTAHNTSVIPLAAITELPTAVKNYLQTLSVDPLLYGGDNPLLNTLAWSSVGLQWQESEFTSDGSVAIASADYGIADTGTVVILSSKKNPARNNFLAEHHIVVLQKEKILPYSDDVWEKLLQEHSQLPRAVNFISGPSSSADVGLKLEYGAHGPRNLAIFLY